VYGASTVICNVRRSISLVLAGLVGLTGCSVDRTGLGDVDAGAPYDAGAMDADARIEPPVDAGGTDADAGTEPPVDANLPDAGPGCTPAHERCAGNMRMVCVGDVLQSEDCPASQHCEELAGAPVCVANICTPDAVRCSADGTEALTCDAVGAGESRVACSRGCDAGGCRRLTPCGAAILATMSSGTIRVDLCGAGTDQEHTAACPWPEQSPAGEDVMIRLEVDRRRAIRFQALQYSGPETIDPTVYLRSACEDMDSEIWCREDTLVQDEDFVETLDPGDYFLVIDRHERVGTSCGVLDVTITPM